MDVRLEASDGYWLSQARADDQPPTATLPDHADVVIVGGGLTGISAAYWLIRAGIDTILLDRRRPGHGATGRSAGLVLSGGTALFNRAVGQFGMETATEVWSYTVESIRLLERMIGQEGTDCDYRRAGSLALALSPTELEELTESVDLLHQAGFDVCMLNRDEVQAQMGIPLPQRVLGAKHCADDSVVDPARLASGLLDVAIRGGLRVFSHTPVLEIREPSSDQIVVQTTRGQVTASMIILTANGWSQHVHPFLAEAIYPVRGQMLATAPLDRHLSQAGFTANRGYDYWRQLDDGRVLIGGFRWLAPDMDEGHESEEVTDRIQTGLQRFLAEELLAGEAIEVIHRWAGVMGFTHDGLPLIGRLPGRNTVLVAAGFNGRGLSYAALTGKVLAELITTGNSSWPISAFSPRRALG